MADNHHPKETTHFGFESVELAEKQQRVKQVFDSVTDRYDVMNDLMSLGLHRLWKRHSILLAGIRPGMKLLDLASGTGDLARLAKKKLGNDGLLVMSDINQNMLRKGRDNMIDHGQFHSLRYTLANAQQLPFKDACFDVVTIGFGLRNVTDVGEALAEIRRILTPGGQLMVLEFSQLKLSLLKPLYDKYSFDWLPRLGKLIAGDADSYQYLAQSIRMHPNQAKLASMMYDAGFGHVEWRDLLGGVVAVHQAWRV